MHPISTVAKKGKQTSKKTAAPVCHSFMWHFFSKKINLLENSGFWIPGKPWKILICGRSRRSVSIPGQINAFANLTWHLPFGLFKFMKPAWIGSLDPWYKVIQDSQSVLLFFFSTKDRGSRIEAALLLIGPKPLLCMVQFDLIPCPQGITPGICNFFLVVYSPPSG